ncbi:MAG: patatin-like phospholipase family protein [Sphingomonas sp.]|nr:patatin-like phospholipase family protein [Sphingomonas sp.]
MIVTFQILSLSGGGYLGLYTAAVLAELEQQSGRRAVEMFDLFAGTSIGGIIALGLAAGASAVDIRDAFLEHGPTIFGTEKPKKSWRGILEKRHSLLKPAHPASPLRQTIERIVGADTKLMDLKRATVIPAVNLTKGGPKVFKTGHHERFVLDWRLSAVDVALATSAAPTYFPIHRIGDELFADGGLFANSPDLIAIHEAEQFLGIDAADINVLSIGTTTTSFAWSGSANTQKGILQWVAGEQLTSAIIGSQQAITDDMTRHRLGDRYVRIDRVQADAQRPDLALDCASDAAKSTLLAMARASIAEVSANESLRAMMHHSAVDRPFINASL